MPKERQRLHPARVLHKTAEEYNYKAGPFFVSSVFWLFFNCHIHVYQGFLTLPFLYTCKSSKYSSFEDRLRKNDINKC